MGQQELSVEQTTGSDVIALPTSPLARDALDFVLLHESPAIANHSVRSYLFARLVARDRGVDLDHDLSQELLYLSCLLHDAGLSEHGDREQRFEVDGADVAAEFLTAKGVSAPKVDAVWEAIALHSSSGIAERRGLLAGLTQAGIVIDFGIGSEFVSDDDGAVIHRAYPRFSMATSLTDVIVDQARRNPAKAPQYSIAADLVRQRSIPPHTTDLEQLTTAGRWGN